MLKEKRKTGDGGHSSPVPLGRVQDRYQYIGRQLGGDTKGWRYGLILVDAVCRELLVCLGRGKSTPTSQYIKKTFMYPSKPEI